MHGELNIHWRVAVYKDLTTLHVTEENTLRIFGRKIIHKIYGPVMESNSWKKQYNGKISKLLKGEDIVRFIKSQRIRCLGHVERMEDNAIPKRMLKGRLYSGRRKGRHRMRWLEELENDLKRMKVAGWKEKMRNREQWRLVVKEAKAHPEL
jgi:GTP1/Obg family GTP-binding protein